MQTSYFLPDSQLEELRPCWHSYLAKVAVELKPEDGAWLIDAPSRTLFTAFTVAADAHEGTIWLRPEGEAFLVPIYNNGPSAADFVCRHQQALASGIVSMVYLTESAVAESDVHQHRQHDDTLDNALQLVTQHMVAVPFYFAGSLRGVVSAVKLQRPDRPVEERLPPFDPEAIATMNHLATLLGQRIDSLLTRFAFGAE